MKKWYMAIIAATIGLGGCRDESSILTQMYKATRDELSEQIRTYEAKEPVVYQVQKAPLIEEKKRDVSPVKTSLEETVDDYDEDYDTDYDEDECDCPY